MVNGMLIGTIVLLAGALAVILYRMESKQRKRRQAIQRRNSQRWQNVFEVTDLKKA